jgi:hypothetical protein
MALRKYGFVKNRYEWKLVIIRWMLAAAYLLLVSYLSYNSTLKMEATLWSETSMDFYRTTRLCYAEDLNPDSYCTIIFCKCVRCPNILKQIFAKV